MVFMDYTPLGEYDSPVPRTDASNPNPLATSTPRVPIPGITVPIRDAISPIAGPSDRKSDFPHYDFGYNC